MNKTKTERMSNGHHAVLIEQYTGRWSKRFDERIFEKRWAILVHDRIQTFKSVKQLDDATDRFNTHACFAGLRVDTPERSQVRISEKKSTLSAGEVMLGIMRLCDATGPYRVPGHIARLGYKQGSVANGDSMLKGVVS